MDRTTLVTGMPIKQTVEGRWVTYHVVINISKEVITILDIETQKESELDQWLFDLSERLQVATKDEMDDYFKIHWAKAKEVISAIEQNLTEAMNYESALLKSKLAICRYFK